MTAAPLRLGSLCSGYGGLDMAAELVLGARAVWHCQYEPPDKKGREDPHQYAARILARHWPVPNHGDITAVDWTGVEPVDVLTAGFPCQDVSSAGKRAGLAPGTRSGLWTHVARAIEALRPSLVLIENVRGLLSAPAHSEVEPCPDCLGDGPGQPALRALGAVLGDLAGIGFDAEWIGLPASAVGAAHERFRVFVLAWPADTPGAGREGDRLPGRPPGPGGAAAHTDGVGGERHGAAGQPEERHATRAGGAASDAARLGEREPADAPFALAESGHARPQPGGGDGQPAAHAPGHRRQQGRSAPAWQPGGSDAALSGGQPAADPEGQRHRHAGAAGLAGLPAAAVAGGPAAASDTGRRGREGSEAGHRTEPALHLADADRSDVAWGPYGPAVRRWELTLGRPAPAPTDDQGRLAPRFVEWLMGLPAGWVTDTPGVPRTAQLKALGNGVVPQHAARAFRLLLDRAAAELPLRLFDFTERSSGTDLKRGQVA